MKCSKDSGVQAPCGADDNGRDWLRVGACAFAIAALVGLQACGGGGSAGNGGGGGGAISAVPSPATQDPPAASAAITQFTPNSADWRTFTSKPRAAGITTHDPDSISWITRAQ